MKRDDEVKMGRRLKGPLNKTLSLPSVKHFRLKEESNHESTLLVPLLPSLHPSLPPYSPHLAVSTQRVLEEESQLAVPKGDVSLVLASQGVDYITEGGERLVDILSLLKPIARGVSLLVGVGEGGREGG